MTSIYNIKKYMLVILLSGSVLLINPFFTTDIFEFPKLVVLLFTVMIMTIINIFDFVMNPEKIDYKKLPIEIYFLGLLLLSNILSYIFSSNQGQSLIGAGMRMQGFLTNIHYILLFLNVLYFFVKYKKQGAESLLKWIKFILVFVVVLALSPYVFEDIYIFNPYLFYDRVFGTLGNPNYLASYIIVTLPFLFVASKVKDKLFKPLWFVSIVVTLIALFLTGSRSAWLAIIGAFLFVGIFIGIKKKHWKMLLVTMLSVFILAGGILVKNISTDQGDEAFDRLSLQVEDLGSAKTRLYLWEAGLKLYLERPIIGQGQERVRDNIEPYLPEYLKANKVFYIDRTHSEFVDVLVNMGALGAFAYLGFLLCIAIKSLPLLWKKKENQYVVAAFLGVLALTMFHSVNFSTITSNVYLYFLLGYLSSQAERN